MAGSRPQGSLVAPRNIRARPDLRSKPSSSCRILGAALSGPGTVTVAPGATLGGYGSITGTVINNGTVAVGNTLQDVNQDLAMLIELIPRICLLDEFPARVGAGLQWLVVLFHKKLWFSG